jgi:peptidoglycan/xylan/chitin deacetylase (PgdA/CDA1 family)
LTKQNFPAAVFLITDRVRDDQSPPSPREWVSDDDETFLSWAEARYLIEDGGFEFGSHTCSHRKLATLPPGESGRELRDSQAAIASRLDLHDFALAYPYGDYSALVAEQARSMGYSCALTTDDGANDGAANAFTLRRTLVGDDDDEAAFAVRVSGAISWISRRRRSGK